MNARLRWGTVVALLLACALAAAGVYRFGQRRPARPADLVAVLPAANASVIYIDVDALRRSRILDMVAGSKTAEEPDYQQFVQETKFDYRQDLNAVAAALKDGRIYFALRGRFQWTRLREYAVRQGGSCHNDFCVVPGSQPDRRISFYPLAPNLMAMAVGPDDFGAYQVANQSGKLAMVEPKEPVWALIPAASLQSMDALPASAKAYLPALKGADEIVLSVGAGRDQQLQLSLHVSCKDAAAASALLAQFETITKALRDLLGRQRQKPDPADFSGVLAAGSFRRDERQVYGTWPLSKAFMDAIAGTVY